MISDENFIRKVFTKLVTADNKEYFSEFLLKLSETLKLANRRYFNSSIFIAKGKNKSAIRWIDFHYWGNACLIQTKTVSPTMRIWSRACSTLGSSSRRSTLQGKVSDTGDLGDSVQIYN